MTRAEVRTVRLTLLVAMAPARWRCAICGGAGLPAEAVPCERCAVMMHDACYARVGVTPAEHAQLAAALVAGTAEEWLDASIVLCPGCRA